MTRIFTLQSVMGVTLLQALALLLPAADVAERNPGPVLSLLAGALMTVLIWENLFTWLRGRELGFHGITTAIIASTGCQATGSSASQTQFVVVSTITEQKNIKIKATSAKKGIVAKPNQLI